MANIYGGGPEIALQNKGYGDFVQHTNPLKEGLLRLVLNEPQTLQVTIGYLQNQAANMPLAYSSLKSFQNPNSGFATNLLKKFQTVNLQSAQTLRNSFGCVQIKLGETPSLKLKADNSLIGLISVREPELVNLLIQLNYREARELANSLIQLNSVGSTESANSLIMSKTCIAGTSPNVLMKSDANHFPSRDETQKAQKEKGSVRSAALWDDCSFNHEENHYSTDLDNNADLRHLKNQQLSHPFLGGEHILTTIGGWDLRLHGTLSPAQTLLTEIIGTQNLQVVKSYSQNNPEIIGAVHSANDISSAQLSGSGLAFLRWRRLISPLAAVTKKPAVLSPSSLSDSIFSITSCGIRTVVICDFAFFAPVTITDTPWDWCMSVYAKKITKKGLWCISLEYSLCCEGEIHLINCEARKCANTNRASIHNVTGANTMAFTHSTQTRPKFTYLFLGTPSDLPTCAPTVLRAEADSEAEARAKFIDWDLTFAAQIRTAAPSRLQLFSTDDGFMWIYEQRQEASHA
ncbi:host cell division inhibitor Icd-like protein [Hafnia paralvei]|nr:host cell division inhibitor Icd-like protein [Hafnia paralvei]